MTEIVREQLPGGFTITNEPPKWWKDAETLISGIQYCAECLHPADSNEELSRYLTAMTTLAELLKHKM
jgi:hypothetical protein